MISVLAEKLALFVENCIEKRPAYPGVSAYLDNVKIFACGGMNMSNIIRKNLDEAFAGDCAYSEVAAAGDWVYLTFCVGNVGGTVEQQVHGALDNMEARLKLVGLTLDSVVKVDVLMRDPWEIPAMEKVFKERFRGNYPARKTIATEFAHKGGVDGLHVQMDAVAYRGK